MGLVLLGLFLLVLPGPGILTIVGGLALLATEFVWAANILEWMKKRYRTYLTSQPPPAPLPAETDYEGG
jgi:uncharacterized protein (TIGR02611 family)